MRFAERACSFDAEKRPVMVALTNNAVRAIRRLMENVDGSVSALRIYPRSETCDRADYLNALEGADGAADAAFQCDDVKVLVDAGAMPLTPDTRLDYVECGRGRGFRFDRPDPDEPCTCEADR